MTVGWRAHRCWLAPCPACGNHRDVYGVEHFREKCKQPDAAADMPTGFDTLGDHNVALGITRGFRSADPT